MQGVDKDAVAAMMEAAGEGVPDDQVDDDAGEDSDDDEEWDAFVDSRMPYVGFSCTQSDGSHLFRLLVAQGSWPARRGAEGDDCWRSGA